MGAIQSEIRNSMKVLLIDPPHKLFPGLRMWTPSFGLLQLGAYLEREGIEVQIVDATALSSPWKDLENTVSASKADVIGITCSATCLSPEAIQAIALSRRLSPGSIIVAGGSHFTLMAVGGRALKDQEGGEVNRRDDKHDGDGEVKHQQIGVAAGFVLAGEEIHHFK